MKTQSSYNERLLHWIWKNRQLSRQPLFTGKNQRVVIYKTGVANETDGPDFLNARIAIGPLTFHGDVEIHWSARDWKRHNHHTDPNYNRVILHAVFNDTDRVKARRQDQTCIPTIYFKPYLPATLSNFAESYRHDVRLPCEGSLSSVSAAVIEEQINEAHKEYFEKKVDELLKYYDPDLPLQAAWQKLLLIALFDGLGIRHNREPMRKLGAYLFTITTAFKNKADLIEKALDIAGIDPPDSTRPYAWKRKGSRPNNHPRHRIVQGCELLWVIKKTPLLQWLRTDICESFNWCREQSSYSPGLGNSRASVLLATVWIPGIYILADLLGKHQYTQKAYNSWFDYRITLPVSATKPFRNAGIPPDIFEKKLGTLHQWRAYCTSRRCERCKVFKNIISS